MGKDSEAVRIVIVRHADAGERESYRAPDFKRPLSEKGERQARKIAKRLDRETCRAISSSPAFRCLETVAPFATLCQLDVEHVDELAEGFDPLRSFEWLLDRASRLHRSECMVACSHGDVMSGMLEVLHERGVDIGSDSFEVQKAGRIELALVGEEITKARLIPAP